MRPGRYGADHVQTQPTRSTILRVLCVLSVVLVLPSGAVAQQSGVYSAAAFTAATQTHSDYKQPMGGTTWGAAVIVGAWVSPGIGLETETSFGGSRSREYTYLPCISCTTARVVSSRRDTYFAFQLRTRAGALEPVIGVAYAYGRVARHAVMRGKPYFDERGLNHGIAALMGVDVPLHVSRHLSIVPTFRAFLVAREGGTDSFDPFARDTRTGALAFRYGAGARVAF
ncbi:MAG: hypothetical protein V7647_2741 [Acidobacteriota bacterium]|jgi:hypothetical protein